MAPVTFEDLSALERAVGTRVAQSDWLTITQAMIDEFADVTGDHQWIHVDPERAARESPYKVTIAHGFLTLSLLSRLIGSAIALPSRRLSLNYGFDRVRFIAPVPVDSEIRASFTVDHVKPTDTGAQVGWAVEVERRGSDKPVLAALWLSRILA
jgi:acyl dehydratase